MLEKDKHMGHIILECLKERPDSICQIDAATGEEETNASALQRSIRLARCLRRLGLVPGDVLALSGRNHLDQQIPYFAALMNGLPITGVDAMLNIDEIKDIFKVTEPKIAFCEPESFTDYVKASRNLGLDTRVYTYGKGEHSMKELLETYQDDTPTEEFEVATFDEDMVYVWLVSTGGTSGAKKIAAFKHATLKNKMKHVLFVFKTSGNMNQPHKPALNLSSIQWISGLNRAVYMPVLHQTKVQTSAPVTAEHVIDIINKYRPVSAILQPELVSSGILISEKHCDMTCFEKIMITGGKVYRDMLQGLRERVNKDTLLFEGYGQTETLGLVFAPNPFGPIGNCGKPFPGLLIKLVDPETGKEITEPNVTGEVWTKGMVFSCYYNNPEETASAFTEDGWYKTGDLLYRDENDNYFFVERLKMLIKYRNYHIIPRELEAVIQSHPGVLNVSVTSIPHEDDAEHPVACVVTRPGCTVTEREIKDLVASKLSDINKLRGGVIFLKELPLTPTGKVAKGNYKSLLIASSLRRICLHNNLSKYTCTCELKSSNN